MEINLKKNQSELFQDSNRFLVAVCGRRFGKTTTMLAKLQGKALSKVGLYGYFAPTYKQAKMIAWDILKGMAPRGLVKKIHETELSIEYSTGSRIRLFGLDRAEGLMGAKFAGAVMDEYDQTKKNVYESYIRPALSDSEGFAWFIGNPDSTKRKLKELYDSVRVNRWDDWSCYHFKSIDGGYIPEKEIELAKRELDPRTFREQYEASFENVEGQVYYGFSLDHNVIDDFDYRPNLPIGVCFDFNVDPFCISFGQIVQREDKDPLRGEVKDVFFFDELRIRNSNTVEICKIILDKFSHHRGGMHIYGDATGNSRHTSSSLSDYQIIIDMLKNFNDFQLRVPRGNPPVKDRINSVNSMMCNYEGDRRVFLVRDKTKNLQKDFMNVIYKEGTTEIDKKDLELTHASDGAGYLLHYEFPVNKAVWE